MVADGESHTFQKQESRGSSLSLLQHFRYPRCLIRGTVLAGPSGLSSGIQFILPELWDWPQCTPLRPEYQAWGTSTDCLSIGCKVAPPQGLRHSCKTLPPPTPIPDENQPCKLPPFIPKFFSGRRTLCCA